MCLGELSGHVGRHIDVFAGVYGEYDVEDGNFNGRMLLEICLEKKLCVKYMV